jgi:hypothetical protein
MSKTNARANFFNGFPHVSDEIRQVIGRGCADAQDFPEWGGLKLSSALQAPLVL